MPCWSCDAHAPCLEAHVSLRGACLCARALYQQRAPCTYVHEGAEHTSDRSSAHARAATDTFLALRYMSVIKHAMLSMPVVPVGSDSHFGVHISPMFSVNAPGDHCFMLLPLSRHCCRVCDTRRSSGVVASPRNCPITEPLSLVFPNYVWHRVVASWAWAAPVLTKTVSNIVPAFIVYA